MEDVGQVQILLAGDVGQVCFGLVHRLGQAKIGKMFLENKKGEATITKIVFLPLTVLPMDTQQRSLVFNQSRRPFFLFKSISDQHVCHCVPVGCG